ncbi:deoxyhypusine synthase family protein [Candidatus Woesearchaeota archaeon]|nr:deoxyhypusine synthase family protein [Candidatus Woesearchaeota archaeon]
MNKSKQTKQASHHGLKALRVVTPVTTSANMTCNDLVLAMEQSGVMGGGKVAQSVRIAETMIRDKECTVFFGFAGAMVPGGMRQVIIDMINDGWVDVVVTTGANLTHDLIEAIGYHHYQGHHLMDDAMLNKEGYDRMYDSLMPNNVYEGLEDFFAKHFDTLTSTGQGGQISIKEFLHRLGSLVPKDRPSILGACYEKNIPLFCPALADSGIGLMLWGHLAKNKKVLVGAFDDLKDMINLAWEAKKAGVWYVGGGVPKNYIQQAMQLAPRAAEYGIQITMDRPEPGGSSGAGLAEGISWGKMNVEAKFVDLICDSTIALPLISAAVKERLAKSK